MNHLHVELEKLKLEINAMSELVSIQLDKAIRALLQNDKQLAKDVLFNEKRVNAYELKIDKDCENIFALYNPVAKDLRFVFATLKSNANFERIGDNAEGIAKFVIDSEKAIDENLLNNLGIEKMKNLCLEMLQDTTLAYVQSDTKIARALFEKDKEINAFNKASTKIIADHIITHPNEAEYLLQLLTMIRKLERIGDLTTNIAEEVIYYVEAIVLKHGKKAFHDPS
jgi:phosphate transport system protein